MCGNLDLEKFHLRNSEMHFYPVSFTLIINGDELILVQLVKYKCM